MDKIIIKVEQLVKRFGVITAVDGISFDVEEGSVFGFLGPNGAGKTTTINILCTLLAPTSGKAIVNGYDCFKQPQMVRKSIGIVFQDTTLDKDLTAYENLAFHAYIYGVKKSEIKARTEESLKFMGLFDRKDSLVKTFSGGMKRRLEVARGLIHRPRVLFLDEPTLGLDPQSRTNLWEAITELPKKHNMTIFMTTHYMEEAEVCKRLAIIDHGRIIVEGSPEELKKTVGGDVIFIRTRDNGKAASEIEKVFDIEPQEKDGELYITVEHGESCIPKLVGALSGSVLSVRLERPTLNEVFLKLTGKEIRAQSIQGSDNIREEVRAWRRRH